MGTEVMVAIPALFPLLDRAFDRYKAGVTFDVVKGEQLSVSDRIASLHFYAQPVQFKSELS